MDKKIAFISIVCGTLLFILVFVAQLFFRIYSGVIRTTELHIGQAIFLSSYLLIAALFIFLCNIKQHKFFLYIIIPILLGIILFVASQLYHGGLLIIDPFAFMWYYFLCGFWAVGIFSGIIDLSLSYFMRRSSKIQKNL
jgi:hypothetical protein